MKYFVMYGLHLYLGLKQEGESCGSCFCPPTYTAGNCAPGLQCQKDPRISDAAGKCVRSGEIANQVFQNTRFQIINILVEYVLIILFHF